MSIRQCSPFMYPLQNVLTTSVQEKAEKYFSKLTEILSPYREFRRFNITQLHEARLFFIAEQHRDQQCITMKKSVVDFFASQGPVIVLHEGLPSGELLIDEEQKPYKKRFIEIYHFDPAYADNIHFVGWDSTEECIRGTDPAYRLKVALQSAEEKLSQQLKKIENLSFRLQKLENKQQTPNRIQTLAAQINELAPGFFDDYGKIDFNIFCKLEKSKYELITEQMIPKLEKLINPHYLNKLHEKILSCITAQEEALQKAEKLSAQKTQAEDDLNKYLGLTLFEQAALESKLIREANPVRNEAFRSTVQNLDGIIHRLQLPHDAPILVITGPKHVKIDKEDEGDPYYDISGLHEELEKNHKAVILIPPHIWD
jgi:hypothetical protein